MTAINPWTSSHFKSGEPTRLDRKAEQRAAKVVNWRAVCRFGLVTVMIAGEPYVIADIGMRMLTPRELFRAQGFPADYQIDRGIHPATGASITFTKKAQTRLVGNSVVPHVAAALIGANLTEAVA